MADGQWTPLMIEERLAEAADVLKRLPPVKVQGYYSLWPRYIYEFADLVGQEPPQLRLPPPSAASITRMDEAMEWLKWLEADDARLAWARAANKPWKEVCWEFGMSRAAAWRRWVMALCIVAMKLNGERLPNGRAQLEQVALQRRRRALDKETIRL